jgi:hypothetical protein
MNLAENSPYNDLAHTVTDVVLNHSFLPNRAAGKEPSQSSGELWMPGLRRFIASGFTYLYLFQKKAKNKEKAYIIEIVIDATQRIFSHLNIQHTIETITILLESLSFIAEGDDIKVDILIASLNSVKLLLYDFPVKNFSSSLFLSELLNVILQNAELYSGVFLFVYYCYYISFFLILFFLLEVLGVVFEVLSFWLLNVMEVNSVVVYLLLRMGLFLIILNY